MGSKQSRLPTRAASRSQWQRRRTVGLHSSCLRAMSRLRLFSMSTACCENVSFDDVKPTEWYADAVRCVVEKGLMSGTGTDAFSPDGTTTRGMLMTILCTGRGCGYDRRCKLVREGHGVGAVGRLLPDGRAPEAGITTMSSSSPCCTARRGCYPEASGTLDAFADADTVSAYAADAMRWAAANGIVNGSHGRLNPQGQCHPRTGSRQC